MRRVIKKFRQWNKRLSDWEDESIDQLVRRFGQFLKRNWNYKDTKNKINTLKNLKVLDNMEYIKLIQEYKSYRSIWYFALCLIVNIILTALGKISISNDSQWIVIYSLIYLIFIMLVLYLFVRLITSLLSLFFSKLKNKKLVNVINRFPVEILLNTLIWPVLFSEYITRLLFPYSVKYLFLKEFDRYLVLNVIAIIVASITIWFVFLRIVKSLPIFYFENSNLITIYLGAILSIIPIVFETNSETKELWTTFIILTTISNFILTQVIKRESNKRQQTAQEVFQEQLLSNNSDYEELKKCYYYGGEKYKEKILSTEKFLRLIIQREIYNINYKRRRRKRRKMNEKKWINGI